ncbi:MAG: aminoacyl-tRNA hydrolase [bacterium]|nr:aminoacyl-tRNA hydrolase [bacterium]
MSFFIYGLGNEGEEYASSRHNAGRMFVDYYIKKREEFDAPVLNNKIGLYVSKSGSGAKGVSLMYSNGFMNNAGKPLANVVKGLKQAEKTIVAYDDIDLPLGTFRIAFNRGDGGHNGLSSVIKYLKTKEFTRIRIGIAQTTPAGKIKKPKDEEKFKRFLLSEFKADEKKALTAVFKKIAIALDCLREESREKCMSLYN